MSFDAATLTTLFQTVLAAFALVALILAWRWLKVWSLSAKLTQETDALTQIGFYASILVGAAEQMLAAKAGPDKLAWVLDQLEDRFPDIDTELLRSFVEAAVLRTPGQLPPIPPDCDDLAPTITGSIARSHTLG